MGVRPPRSSAPLFAAKLDHAAPTTRLPEAEWVAGWKVVIEAIVDVAIAAASLGAGGFVLYEAYFR